MKTIALFLTTIFITLTEVSYSQIGDSCSTAIPMPYSNNSILTGNILTGGIRWFTFIPLTPEVEITLTNTDLANGHIHDLLLMEGLCNLKYFTIGFDNGNDTVLKIIAHDLIVGVPYLISTIRERATSCESVRCKGFAPAAKFDLQVQSLLPPVVSDSNGIVFLNGVASHVKNEVIIRISKTYLKMNSVDNTSQNDMPIPVFVQPTMLQKMANAIMGGNVIGLGQLHLKKVFPNMTSADSISISRMGEPIRIPDFWETFILTIPDTTSIFKASRALSGINGTRFSEPNYVSKLTSVPDDNFYSVNQGSLHPTITYPNGHINVENAWDIETGKPFVRIGVYDTGIDQNHDELSGGKIAGGYDFESNISLSAPFDNAGHGTSCAGIIGAYRNNTTGIAGIAGGDGALNNSGCSLFDMKIKLTGSSSQDFYVMYSKAANAIINGATSTNANGYGLHIMNNSWGIPNNYSGLNLLHDAVQYAVQNSVVFIASRGNDGNTSSKYPASFQDEMVISVGASGTDGNWKTTANGSPAYSSSYGGNVDIIAPGCDELVYTTETNTNGYRVFSGTSAAAPHVSGVAGLILSHVNQPFPTLTNFTVEDVENILQLSALDKTAPPAAMGYDAFSGFGLLNAANALNKVKKPAYKVQHFGIGQNASSNITFTKIGTNVAFLLPTNYQSLAAGTYYGDKYMVTIVLNYNLNSSNDQILNFWPRFSSTIGWSAANPIQTDNWCQVVSVTSTQAVLRTYIYNFLRDQNGQLITDPWFPTQSNPKAAISIYTFDPTVVGIDEMNNDGSSFSAFPNPANNTVNFDVTLSDAQQISLELFDVQGKFVKQIAKENVPKGTQRYTLSLSDFSEGIYYYRLITDKVSYSKKLVIIK
ncbi:MAG: S8 family peptidase [Vicingaceae bacterium]|nr:S8 family peptidase [Vicingaceae bacterium]